ncbi:MAG: hypothetical protein OEV43_00875, partial [Coriobacteriia bacterium]|nr:hypothetical protein [Coriobacteriia bacterium]
MHEHDGEDVCRDDSTHPAELHEHRHEHDGVVHEHTHHHGVGTEAHAHGHALAFDTYSSLCTPVHDLDPRAKIIAALILVFAVVLTPPPRAAEFALLAALLLATTAIADIPLRVLLARSAIVLPIAGTIALFAPLARHGGSWSLASVGETYAGGWLVAWGIVSKAWLSAYTTLLVTATTPPARLFQALRALRMPAVFVTMLVFLYRYAAVLGSQLRSLRRAVASRGFGTRGRRLISLYGNLAGNL